METRNLNTKVVKRLKEPVKRVILKSDEHDLITPVKRLINPVSRLNENNLVINYALKNEKNQDNIPFVTLENLEQQMMIIQKMRTFKIPSHIRYIKDYLFNEINNWDKDDYIFISSGTGTGKTYFVQSLIKEKKSSVLILTNRTMNKFQIKKALEIEEKYMTNIWITSYQEIEKNEHIEHEYLDEFEYIVCDESHYFLKDSPFNPSTNSSYKKIMATTKAKKIFMSATNDEVLKLVIKELLLRYKNSAIVYSKIFNYKSSFNSSVIDNIFCFTEFKEILPKINDSNEKWLIFVRNKEQGNKISEILLKEDEKRNDFIFVSRELVDKNDTEINEFYNLLISESILNKKITISTSILDNGVNVIERALKNIVVYDNSYVELIQMVGRKRCIDAEDSFDLYLTDDTVKSLQGCKQQVKNRINKLYTVKSELMHTDEINLEAIAVGSKYDNYRRCIFKDPYTKKIAFNRLGLIQAMIEKDEIERLILSKSSYKSKVKWVCQKLINQPIINYDKSGKYIIEVMELIDHPISKKDKDAKIKLNNAYIEVYGRDCKTDKKGRTIKLSRLREKYQKRDIPIVINETKDTFTLKLNDDDTLS